MFDLFFGIIAIVLVIELALALLFALPTPAVLKKSIADIIDQSVVQTAGKSYSIACGLLVAAAVFELRSSAPHSELDIDHYLGHLYLAQRNLAMASCSAVLLM
jgi:hypothetical protein